MADTVTAIGVIGSIVVVPGVAAYVALRMHRERLAHERDLADAEAFRGVAHRGFGLLKSVDSVARRDPGPDVWAEIEDLTMALHRFEQELLLWFNPEHEVVEQWQRIEQALWATASQADGAAALAELRREIREWQRLGVALGGVRLGSERMSEGERRRSLRR